jgi:hypothetical protein
MLNQLNQGNGRIYKQERIKKQFSEALKELENFVKKKKPTQPQSEQPKSNPERDTPVNSNKSPETQDNSENNQNPNGTNNPNSPNLTDLQTLKNQTIFEITNSLNQKPKLENSDLSSEYHN